VIVTEIFEILADHERQAKGLPSARVAVIAHPLGGATDVQIREKANDAFGQAMKLLGVDE
jgi:hypothetical protein